MLEQGSGDTGKRTDKPGVRSYTDKLKKRRHNTRNGKSEKHYLKKSTRLEGNPQWLNLWAAMLRTASGDSDIYQLAEEAGLEPARVLAWFTQPEFTEWLGREATQYIRAGLRMYEIKMASQIMEGQLPPLKVIEYLAKRHDPGFADRKEILHKLEAPEFTKMSVMELATYAASLLPVYARTEDPGTMFTVTEVTKETDGTERRIDPPSR